MLIKIDVFVQFLPCSPNKIPKCWRDRHPLGKRSIVNYQGFAPCNRFALPKAGTAARNGAAALALIVRYPLPQLLLPELFEQIKVLPELLWGLVGLLFNLL